MDAVRKQAIPNELQAQLEEFHRDLEANHSEALWNALHCKFELVEGLSGLDLPPSRPH